MKKTNFIILLILFPLIAFSQQKMYKISGIIVDSINQNAIPFATITLMKLPEKSILKQKVAKDDGRFDFQIETKGEYILAVSSLGYKTKSKKILITNEQIIYDFGEILMNIDAVELNSINIFAHKPLVKVESDKLIYSVESDVEAKTSDGLEILEKVPMLIINSNEKILVNGNENVKIYINGKKADIVTKNLAAFLQNTPASLIKSIEVITKPGAKYDAEFNGSIINIIMQKKSKGYICSFNSGIEFTKGLIVRNGVNFTATFGKFGASINISNKSIPKLIYDKNTYRENFIDNKQKYINWAGEAKDKWFYLPIFVDLSYAVDTLNLINISFNSSYNKAKHLYDADINIQNNLYDLQQSYTYNNSDINFAREYVGNINYQNISKKDKNRILTLSYQFNYTPIFLKNKYSIDSILNYQSAKQISEQNETWSEHTCQIDYKFPVNDKSELESGAKYIIREDKSSSNIFDYQFLINQFIENTTLNDAFTYKQNIIAAYFTYALKFNKFSLKLGIRGEASKVSGTFISADTAGINHTIAEFVPNSSINYQLTKSQVLRFSYSKKIKRPSVWHINPYIDKSNPNNYYFGNPNIKTEHFHNFELNYGNFGKFGMLNLSFSYGISDDGIARVISKNNAETSSTTFNNIAKTQKYISSLSLMLKLGKKIRFRINSSADYNILENTNDTTSLHDWGYVLSSSFNYKIVKGLKFSVSVFYFQPADGLQTKVSALYTTQFKIKKEFLNKKLNISLFYKDAFWRYKSIDYVSFDDTFYQKMKEIRRGYSFGIKISCKFGKMKNQFKRVIKDIYNNDLKSRG